MTDHPYITDEAVQAGAAPLEADYPNPAGTFEGDALMVLAAALPHIEPAIRAEADAEIRRLRQSRDDLATEWEAVCAAAGLAPDATSEEVISHLANPVSEDRFRELLGNYGHASFELGRSSQQIQDNPIADERDDLREEILTAWRRRPDEPAIRAQVVAELTAHADRLRPGGMADAIDSAARTLTNGDPS